MSTEGCCFEIMATTPKQVVYVDIHPFGSCTGANIIVFQANLKNNVCQQMSSVQITLYDFAMPVIVRIL